MSDKKPYPGIRPFEEEEADIFFGREDQIQYLNQSLTKKFVAVIGSSGSGKSSLVKAGLIPHLRHGNWVIGTMKPQRSPIKNLVKMIAALEWEINKQETFGKAVQFNIDLSSNGLVETYSQSMSEKRLLLIIDQFEELFNFKDEKVDNKTNPKNVEEALKFVSLLVQAAKSSESISILITMRSEFLGNCSEFKGLPELINEGQFLIPRLTRGQFKDAIVKPVERYGVSISSSLVSQMLNDIEYDPDQLPVLQHSLMRMWKEFKKSGKMLGGTISQDIYKAVGGMLSAIDQHANDILGQLSKNGLQEEARIIFQRITKKSPDGVGIRSPQSLVELVDVTGVNRDKLVKVIEAFREEGVNFLMPPPKETIAENTDIDIAHETLIRKWLILKDDWMIQEAENKRMLDKLAEREEEYGKDNKTFLTGALLATYLNWSKYHEAKKPKTIAWAKIYTSRFAKLIEFIDTSVVLNKKLEHDEEKRRRRLKTATRVAVGAVTSIIIFGLIAVIVWQEKQQDSDKQAQRIDDQNQQISRLKDSIKTITERNERRIDEINKEKLLSGTEQEVLFAKHRTTIGNLEKAARANNQKIRSISQRKTQDSLDFLGKQKVLNDTIQEIEKVAKNLTLSLNISEALNIKLKNDLTILNQNLQTQTTTQDFNLLLTTQMLSSKIPDSLFTEFEASQLKNATARLSAKSKVNLPKLKVDVYASSFETQQAETVIKVMRSLNISFTLKQSTKVQWPPGSIKYFKDENLGLAYLLKALLVDEGQVDFKFQREFEKGAMPDAIIVLN